MPGHLKHLEHKGGELLLPEEQPNRKKVKKQEIELQIEEVIEAKSLAQKQVEYLSPENPELWDNEI